MPARSSSSPFTTSTTFSPRAATRVVRRRVDRRAHVHWRVENVNRITPFTAVYIGGFFPTFSSVFFAK